MRTVDKIPYSHEAEQSVIGALLLTNDAFDRIGDLSPDHFYRADHKIIFAEIVMQLTAGKTVDVISLNERLKGKVDDCLQYLNSLANSTPSSFNIARYAGIVQDKAIKRGLMEFGNELFDMSAGHEDSAELLDRASSRLEKLAENRVKQEPKRASDLMVSYIEEIENRYQGAGARAISTGFEDVDKRLSGGIRGGELIVVAARPKMGKTAFTMNVGVNIAAEHTVLFLSMEMPATQLLDRNVANLGRVNLSHLMQPTEMTDAEWSGLTRATQKIHDLGLFIDDQGGLKLLDVRLKARNLKRKHGLKVLIIDYLQLMEGEGANRNAQIEGITRGLKALAKELDIGIFLLSQLNRELEKRPNKRPQPSDLRDSGAIEQDADAIIFLYRDEVYNSDTPDKGMCEIDVALCRQGAPGKTALVYLGDQTRFENAMNWRAPQQQKDTSKRGLAASL